MSARIYPTQCTLQCRCSVSVRDLWPLCWAKAKLTHTEINEHKVILQLHEQWGLQCSGVITVAVTFQLMKSGMLFLNDSWAGLSTGFHSEIATCRHAAVGSVWRAVWWESRGGEYLLSDLLIAPQWGEIVSHISVHLYLWVIHLFRVLESSPKSNIMALPWWWRMTPSWTADFTVSSSPRAAAEYLTYILTVYLMVLVKVLIVS